MKLIFKILFSVLLLLIAPGKVQASDAFFTCNETSCTPGTIASFFPADKWHPGMIMSKTFSIHNTSGEKRTFGLSAFNESVSGNLDNIITLSVKETGKAQESWNGTVRELFTNDEISLEEILAGEIKEFAMTFTMDLDAGNNYQDKSLSFDLNIGLLQPPADNGGDNGGDGGDGGGDGGGTGPTATPPAGGGTGEAVSRFTITNLVNRSRTEITPPVLGIEEISIQRSAPRRPPNPWMSSLFRGVSCRLNSWAGFLVLIQPVLSFLLLKYDRKRKIKEKVFSLFAIALLANFVVDTFTCFALLSALWLSLFWLTASFYYLSLRFKSNWHKKAEL